MNNLLMRSRYDAFVRNDGEYLATTTTQKISTDMSNYKNMKLKIHERQKMTKDNIYSKRGYLWIGLLKNKINYNKCYKKNLTIIS